MNKAPIEKTLNPTVFKLGLVSFFADISSEMLYPITPIFLTAVLGASMSSLGLIEGLAEAIASLMKTYSGSWSDRIQRRKPFIIAGYFLAAISKPLIGFSNSWAQVLSARALDRTGKGLRTAPRDALLSEAVSEKNRGAAFGWHRMMDTLGAALGPLLAISFLAKSPNELRPLYYWAIVPGLCSILVLFSVAESKPVLASTKKWVNPFSELKNLDFSFKKYLLAWTFFSLTNSSDVFLLMKAKSSGLELIPLILIYCAYNLVYALLSPYLGGLSDRIGRKKLLLAGLLCFAGVYVGFGFAEHTSQFIVLFLIYGIYMAATDGVGKAFAIDLVPAHLKATGLGLLGTLTGVSTLFASICAGLIWDHFGANFTFIFGASGALAAFLILLTLKTKTLSRY